MQLIKVSYIVTITYSSWSFYVFSNNVAKQGRWNWRRVSVTRRERESIADVRIWLVFKEIGLFLYIEFQRFTPADNYLHTGVGEGGDLYDVQLVYDFSCVR